MAGRSEDDDDPFEWPAGDNLSLSWWPLLVVEAAAVVVVLDKLRPFSDDEDELDDVEDDDLVLFSMLAKSFGLGVESAPIELQV